MTTLNRALSDGFGPHDGVPALLTVEEAAAILRIGRTKAYAMVAEWRATGGASGLPVVDLGRVLRVPLRAIEDLVDRANAPRS